MAGSDEYGEFYLATPEKARTRGRRGVRTVLYNTQILSSPSATPAPPARIPDWQVQAVQQKALGGTYMPSCRFIAEVLTSREMTCPSTEREDKAESALARWTAHF